MNSKANIFTVLQRHDDSDDERRPTKKEYRAIDKNLREGQGDTVNKDPYAAKQHKPHHGTTAPSRDGKREFDRKSGTVKQAFGNSRQKGGKREDDREIRRQNKDNAEGHEEDHEGAEEQAEEEDESTKAISMEDYLKERNLLEDTRAEEQQDLNLAKIQQDTGMKVMNKKTAPVETGVIKKNNDISALSRAPQNSIYGSNREAAPADRFDRDRDGERGGRGRGGRGRGGPRGGRGGPRRDDREERTERTEKTDKPEGQEAAEGDQKERKPFRGGDRADRGGDRTDKGGDRADRGDRGSPRGGRGGRGGSRGGQGGQGAPQQPRSHKSGNTNLTADDFPKL